ncbi:hypothetical protein OHA72_01390 [Dactylosporangium sp. NBC_01737]|uniref:hypothetical protein n=1 Tax=Dactylosporangium sp. NBC_01737 TaxID=2975959 RepID=UPI002E0FA549|nr:hypothetical protein OHA72_01390 [Dactylosporangium sp. NBC_01737]
MHVTITADDAGRLTVRPAADATTPGSPDSVTVLLCPPDAYDRRSGTLVHPYRYTPAPTGVAAAPVYPPRDATVVDLNAPTVLVAIHPLSRRLLAVGPFTGPDRAQQWWHADSNQFATSGTACHVLPLPGNDNADHLDTVIALSQEGDLR